MKRTSAPERIGFGVVIILLASCSGSHPAPPSPTSHTPQPCPLVDTGDVQAIMGQAVNEGAVAIASSSHTTCQFIVGDNQGSVTVDGQTVTRIGFLQEDHGEGAKRIKGVGDVAYLACNGPTRANCRLMSYASGRVVTADVSLIGADSVMLSNAARGVVLAALASTPG